MTLADLICTAWVLAFVAAVLDLLLVGGEFGR